MKKFFLCSFLLLVSSVFAFANGQTDEEKAGGPVEITWAFWGVEPVEFLKAYNESQDKVRVVYEQIASDQYVNILNVRLASGEAPELFATRFDDIYETLVKEDQIVDLSEKAFMNNFESEAIRQVTADDGKVYGFPATAVSFLGFYNKEIFDRLNLDPPQNWDEYLAVSKVLKDNDIVPQIQGAKDLWQARHIIDPVQVALSRHPDTVKNLSTGEGSFEDPEIMAGWNMLEDFVSKGYLHEGSIGLTFNQAWELFCKGEAAMMQGGTWFASQAFKYFTPEFDYGIIPFPLNRAGEDIAVPFSVKSANTVVNKNSENVEAAIDFVEWFCQPENLKLYASDTKNMSAGIGVKPDFSESALKMAEFLEGKTKYEYAKPLSALESDYYKVMQEIIVGGSAADAASSIQKKLEAIIQ